jgi:hypothetical protein
MSDGTCLIFIITDLGDFTKILFRFMHKKIKNIMTFLALKSTKKIEKIFII